MGRSPIITPAPLVALAGLLVAPLIFGAKSLDVLTLALLYWIMAMGLSVVVTECGLLDLGFAGFVCVGAYSSAVAMGSAGLGFWSSLPFPIFFSATAGFLFALPLLRLRGDYFAILSFGFSELVVLLMRNWRPVTNGPFGLGGIGDPSLLGFQLQRHAFVHYYFFVLALGVAVACLLFLFRRTCLRAAMLVSREDEASALAMGVDIDAVRVFAVTCSAAVGGLAGAVWASYFRFISFPDFGLTLSVFVLLVVIVARQSNPVVLLISSLVLVPLVEFLRRSLRDAGLPEEVRLIAFGSILCLHATLLGRGAPANALHQEVIEVSPAPGFTSVSFLVEKLSVSFGANRVLRDVSLAVAPGEAVAIVGANGSGKTTLLNAISGFTPSRGVVRLGDRHLEREPSWMRARGAVGRTFQQMKQPSEGATLKLAVWLATRRQKSRITSRVADTFQGLACTYLDGFGFRSLAPDLLPFAVPAPLILLDEPLPGRTQSRIGNLLDAIKRHKDAGGILLIVEHRLEEILSVIDKILYLVDGEVVFFGSIEAFEQWQLTTLRTRP